MQCDPCGFGIARCCHVWLILFKTSFYFAVAVSRHRLVHCTVPRYVMICCAMLCSAVAELWLLFAADG